MYCCWLLICNNLLKSDLLMMRGGIGLKKCRFLLVSIVLSSSMGVCFAQKADQSSTDELKARVLQRWTTLQKHDFEDAYTYRSPAFRKVFSLTQFKASKGVSVIWVDADVLSVVVEGHRAEVSVGVDFKLSLPGLDGERIGDDVGLVREELKEVWLWRENNWWIVNPLNVKL